MSQQNYLTLFSVFICHEAYSYTQSAFFLATMVELLEQQIGWHEVYF
jgi:hypothetical protein